MIKRGIILISLALTGLSLSAQVRIDSSFAFSIHPAKKYSIYLPTAYNPSVPSPMIVGFHPLDIVRWNAKSWCDTLKQFCEANNVILLCPDGDADGNITDPIDYDFTTVLIDSAKQWFNVNANRIYALGFSEGGKAVYEYGLNHIDLFGGFIPVGPAISGSAFVNSTIHNAGRKPFYLVHGSLDANTTRYYPMLSALRANSAKVDT
jgi:predicted peptidase